MYEQGALIVPCMVSKGKGLLRVVVVPLGPVLLVKVVLMLGLSSTLKVKVEDVLRCDCVEHRM